MSAPSATAVGRLTYWHPGAPCCDEQWEQAYARFETPEQEIAKFLRRDQEFGLHTWPKSLQIVDLFCGRGNGLRALERLGFSRLEGVDLSPTLLARYDGAAKLYVADCRKLQFPDQSRDAVVIQGGLHHLPRLPDDLERTLAEIRRILRPEGRVVIVEPWLTPFLRGVHAACRIKPLRRLWPKLDALACMIEHERQTYEQWLNAGDTVLSLLGRYFHPQRQECRLGKLMFMGTPRAAVPGEASARRATQ